MSKILEKTFLNSKYRKVGKLSEDVEINFKMIFNRKINEYDKSNLAIIKRDYNLEKRGINDFYIDFKGKVSDINRMFQTEIGEFKFDGKKYYSELSEVVIPYGLDFVGNVIGLNNVPKFKHHSQNSNMKTGFTPVDIAELYDFPLYFRGANRNIAIIELGGGYRQDELEYYFLNYLKNDNMPTIIPIPLDGATNNPKDPISEKVMFDIEVAGAIAKCSTIVVYFAPNNDLGFYDAIYFAITNLNYRPCCLSISWGAPESENTSTFMESVNLLFKEGVKNYMNIFCSSGDSGSSDGLPGLNVDFPSSSPYAIACGGTKIIVENKKIVNEIVWSGSGGGYSNIFTKPAYQDIEGTQRGVPDLAGNADPDTGYIILYNKELKVMGGTSAVASLYAGLNAICSQALGSVRFFNDIIYKYENEVCYDIVEGSNGPDGKWDAKVGWDACTGNGRIYGVRFLVKSGEILKNLLGI